MTHAKRTKIIQPVVTVIALLILFIAPLRSFSQGDDWCVVTIESVKCIKPSTGQDAYTTFLFKGIEIAIQAAMAVGSGGTSLTATAATQLAKETLKKTIKAGLKIAVINQAKNFYAANKDEIMDLANIGNGDGNSDLSKAAGVALEVYKLTTLQGIFNKVYGESPDDLYIKVDGNKVWPDGKSVSIKSQQQLTVGASFKTQKIKGFSIQLMEYDYGSNDDDLGVLTFKIPPNFAGTYWIEDQVFHHEEEGSVYMITMRVETFFKHRFIHNLANSSWDFKINDGASNVLNFEPTTLDFPDMPGWNGYSWRILTPDLIRCHNPNAASMNIRFDSENSFSGTFDDNTKISGTRRASMHRYINNLVGLLLDPNRRWRKQPS